MSGKGYKYATAVMDRVRRTMYGMDDVVRLCLVALFSGGHVLLEGNPGMGKTELVKTLARDLVLPWGRIQFTPDLMPADITGTLMPTDSGRLEFTRGPIFTSLLLADEINRATPKTQSAMLEAMAEKQATVLGKRHLLEEPFFVMATQNPIDHQGTYDLPEAQADRFMFKILVPYPNRATIHLILSKTAGKLDSLNIPTPELPPLTSNTEDERRTIARMKKEINDEIPDPTLLRHIQNLYDAVNHQKSLEGIDRATTGKIEKLVARVIEYGFGPRAVTAMLLGAKAWGYFGFDTPTSRPDGYALGRVIVPILRHRLKVVLDWEELFLGWYGEQYSNKAPVATIETLIRELCVLTAPNEGQYRTLVQRGIDDHARESGWG